MNGRNQEEDRVLAGSVDRSGITILLITITVLCSSALAQLTQVDRKSLDAKAREGQALRPFTVADSIESTHFVVPEEHTSEHPPVSPDGKKFFIVTQRGLLDSNLREYALVVFDFEHLNEPRRMVVLRTSSNRPGIDRAKWVSDDTIAFIGENPYEVPQVFVVTCHTRKVQKLTAAPTGVAAFDVTKDLKTVAYYTHWQPDEAEIKTKEEHGFAVTDEMLTDLVNGQWKHPPEVYQMFILDPGSGKLKAVRESPFFQNAGRLGVWLSPDGRYALACEPPVSIPKDWVMYDNLRVKRASQNVAGKINKIRDDTLDQVMLVDIDTGELRPLVDAPLLSILNVVWMGNSRAVMVSGTALPLNTADPEELARRKKKAALVEVTVPDLSFRRIMDLSDDEYWVKLRPGLASNSFVIEGLQKQQGGAWTPLPERQYRLQGGKWLEDNLDLNINPGARIKISETNDCWPKLVKADAVTDRKTTILDPNPQFRHLRFGHEEILHWTGNLGQPLVGGLLYPPNYLSGKKYPLVIQSYQFNQDEFLIDGPSTTAYAAQALVNHDIFVLQLSQSSLYDATIGTPDFGRTELSQIDSAVEYLDKLGLVNTESIGLTGFSIKGYQVTYAITHSKYHFSAATAAEGNDWSYWNYVVWANFPGLAGQNEGAYGGPPWNGNWQSWMRDSITFNFEKIHTPLRLEADIGEYGAAISEWEKFMALKRLHRPVELICQMHGWHPVVRPWDRMTSQQGNVDWMVFWLKGEEDPDPAKAAQYARWHELRKLQQLTTLDKESLPPN
jgi:hypothetical protein